MAKNKGSPPPMRGKVVMSGGYIGQTRITPAYAGKSIFEIISMFGSRDHPRLCGEKDQGKEIRIPYLGSPPPMRGKVAVQCDAVDHGGITPAYAGKRIEGLLESMDE